MRAKIVDSSFSAFKMIVSRIQLDVDGMPAIEARRPRQPVVAALGSEWDSIVSRRDSQPLALANAWTAQSKTSDNATEIQFVSRTGSDSNDGRTIDRAKKTIYAALEDLQGGERAPPTAGHGIVWVSDSVEYGGPLEGDGIWLMGPHDLNFEHVPTGWMRYTGGIRIVCLGNANSAPDQHIPQCRIRAGGNLDNQHPAVWLSSFAGGFYLEGLGFSYPQVGVRIGIDSSGDRRRGAVQNVELKNIAVNLGRCPAGAGPGVDIGDSTFWIWIIDSFIGGCGNSSYAIAASPFGLSRSKGTVTVNANTVTNVFEGQVVSIYNPTDPLFSGSCLVTAIPDQHHVRCTQQGPDASSGGGWLLTGQSSAVNVDPGGGSGAGLLFFRDDVFDVSGPADGIRFQNGLNGGSIDVQSQTCEGGYKIASGPCIHVYWNPLTSPVVNVNVWHVESADNNNGGNLRAPAVQVDGPFDPSAIIVANVSAGGAVNVAGPMTVLGQYVPNLNGIVESPLRESQIGFFHNRIVGSTDAARRLFAPTAIRYVNLAPTSAAEWILNNRDGATIKLGVNAPDGTSNAATASEESGPQNAIIYYSRERAVALGDYFIGGVWTKASNGYNGGLANFSLRIVGDGNHTVGFTQPAPYRGDGEWEWLFSVQKLTASNKNLAQVSIVSNFGVKQSITAYAPVLIHIPAGSLSDNEAYEFAYNLASYDSTCGVGSICALPTQVLQIPGDVKGQFLIADQGKSFTTSNVTLSPGWGNSAKVSAARGSSQRFIFTLVSNGTSIAANPKISISFPTPWPVVPTFICKQVGGTGPIAAVSGEVDATVNGMTLTSGGVPVAGDSYSFACEGE